MAGSGMFILAARTPAAEVGAVAPMIDGHAHYTAADVQAFPPEAVVARLDAAGVSRIVVTGTPPELACDLYRHAPGRVVPLLGVYEAADGDAGEAKARWMHDADLPRRVRERLELCRWAGLGELHLFAADVHSPVFGQLVRLAQERDGVLLLHGDAEVVDRALSLAPGVRVLWAHLGTQPEPERLERLLARYAARLWIDTSVRDERIAPHGRLLPEWWSLFERYPDRFVVGVDTFSTHRWEQYAVVVKRIRAWTDDLPMPLRDKLLRGNAERLFANWR